MMVALNMDADNTDIRFGPEWPGYTHTVRLSWHRQTK